MKALIDPIENDEIEIITDELLQNSENWTPFTITHFGPDSSSILLTSEITQESSAAIISQLLELERLSPEYIIMYINSGGGSATDMWAIYDMMRIIETPIITIGLGIVGSAALLIFFGGDKRVATPNCQFFYHEPVMGTEVVQVQAAQNTVDTYTKLSEDMNDIIKGRSKIPARVWREKFASTSCHHFSAQQALEWKMVDEIIAIPKKNKLTNKKWI